MNELLVNEIRMSRKIKIEKYVLREPKYVFEMNHRWEAIIMHNELE